LVFGTVLQVRAVAATEGLENLQLRRHGKPAESVEELLGGGLIGGVAVAAVILHGAARVGLVAAHARGHGGTRGGGHDLVTSVRAQEIADLGVEAVAAVERQAVVTVGDDLTRATSLYSPW